MARRTFITGDDIEDASVRPEDLGITSKGVFVKVDNKSGVFKGQPGRIYTSPPTVKHLQDAVGIEIPYGGLFQKAAILGGMPDYFLFAHKKYQVEVTVGDNALAAKYLFDGRGDTAILVNPTDPNNFPIKIEVQHTGQIVHGDYGLFVFHDWRYYFSQDYYGGQFIDWEVWVLNHDTGEWEKRLERIGSSDVFPFVFTVGQVRVRGIRIVISKALGSTWASNLLYLTGFSCYYTGGGAPWDAVGAVSLAGGRIYGALGFHEDATIEIAGQYTLTTTRDIVVDMRWNGDTLEMHKMRYVFRKGYLVSIQDMGWEPVPKVGVGA